MRNELITIAKDMDTTGNALATKRTLYDDICLNAFIIGLKDPLRTIIRIRNPDTIEKLTNTDKWNKVFLPKLKQTSRGPSP